jgi:hypothetical protein
MVADGLDLATGARRLMVEVFSWPEFELFASEVLPRLRDLPS